jgi:hypothetical protein
MSADGTAVKLFEKRINWLNQCLKYFPIMIKMTDGQLKTCEPVGEDDLHDIYTLAIKKEWTFKIMESNADPYDHSLTEQLIKYLEKLEQVDKMKRLDPEKSIKPTEGRHQQTNMIRGDINDEQNDTYDMDNKEEIKAACSMCGKLHHG